jgi:hypothetical protein
MASYELSYEMSEQGILKGGSISVRLTSCLTGLEHRHLKIIDCLWPALFVSLVL